MFRKYLRSKLHRVKITSTDLDYIGSLTIPACILAKSGLKPYEIIDVYNINNGNRFTTYIIEGSAEDEFCVNGAAARLVEPGDRVIIVSFQYISEASEGNIKVKVLNFDNDNTIIGIQEKQIENG